MKKATKRQAIQRMIGLDGLLNMHERARAAGRLCKLNGAVRSFDMAVIDCGTAACLHGSALLTPWFKEQGYREPTFYFRGADFCKPGFFGDYDTYINGIYGMVHASLPEVRAALRALILEVGGQRAIDRCEANKARGDQLAMGISDLQLPNSNPNSVRV